MPAWTVDADDIRVAEDFDDALLHRAPEIDAFLTFEREDKFIVIGTKGFGKTLLLNAKRVLYQRARPSAVRTSAPGRATAHPKATCWTSPSATRSSAATRLPPSPCRRCPGPRCGWPQWRWRR